MSVRSDMAAVSGFAPPPPMPATWVLLRGLTREQRHWGPFAATLASALTRSGAPPGLRVVAVDLSGAGDLHAETSPIQVAGMLPACRAQLDVLGVAPPYALVALSLGGMVATQWACAAPDEVARLVLINTSMRPLGRLDERLAPRHWPMLLRLLVMRDARSIELAVWRLTSRLPPDDGVVRQWATIRHDRPVKASNALRQLLAAARFRLPVRHPCMPVLVAASAADDLVDPRCSRRLAAHWDVPLVEHPTAGHDLPLDDGPWLAAEIARWCGSPL